MKISTKKILFTFCLGLFLLFSCNKTSEPYPEISIQVVSQVRTTLESAMTFYLNISKPTEKSVSVERKIVCFGRLSSKGKSYK